MEDISEKELLKLSRNQERKMKRDGTFHGTKYSKGDKILYKKKGWSSFQKGKITNVNKTHSKITYNIKLITKFKGKSIYKNVLSSRIKKEEKKDILDELQELIKTQEGSGKKAMEEKFKELCAAKEKKELAISKKKDK